jgi:ABC-type sugar transport system substrate-binding protein
MLHARLLTRLLTAALVVAPLLSACGGDEPTIAVLVGDAGDDSSRVVDVERLTDRVESTCDECRVRVYDAEGDAAAQKSQARQAQADSADVVVVVPVDPDDLGTLTGGDLPVISLGELVPGSDRFVGLESGTPSGRSGSDVEAAREVLMGKEKSMTYVPTGDMSDRAADLAVAYLADNPVEGGVDVDGVESWLYRDHQVTVDTLTSVLVAEGIMTLDDLCSGTTRKRCASLGLR